MYGKDEDEIKFAEDALKEIADYYLTEHQKEPSLHNYNGVIVSASLYGEIQENDSLDTDSELYDLVKEWLVSHKDGHNSLGRTDIGP